MAEPAKRPRVVIAGFGETGVLVAMRLPKTAEIIAVSTKPLLVSGQELGARLTAPDQWKRDYLTEFRRFRKLDHVSIVEGRATALDPASKTLEVESPNGATSSLDYDYLIIASGITNGFWRNDAFSSQAEIEAELAANAAQLAAAKTVAIVGGGPSGVSSVANLAATYPNMDLHLFHTGDIPLPGYHPESRAHVLEELKRRGVHLHPHHRAVLPEPDRLQRIDGGQIAFEDGHADFAADAIIWATGAARPNSSFLPRDMLDARGFVLTEPTLQLPGYSDIFAIGDVAATDSNRSSARNWAYNIIVHNVGAMLKGQPDKLKQFVAPPNRWGSIIALQDDGLTIYQPNGKRNRMSRWVVETFLYPIAVRRVIYRGVR